MHITSPLSVYGSVIHVGWHVEGLHVYAQSYYFNLHNINFKVWDIFNTLSSSQQSCWLIKLNLDNKSWELPPLSLKSRLLLWIMSPNPQATTSYKYIKSWKINVFHFVIEGYWCIDDVLMMAVKCGEEFKLIRKGFWIFELLGKH